MPSGSVGPQGHADQKGTTTVIGFNGVDGEPKGIIRFFRQFCARSSSKSLDRTESRNRMDAVSTVFAIDN